jgi:hypothetical protein
VFLDQEAVILFLVEDVTYNIGDQKFHEFEIRRQCPEAMVIRKTLTEVGQLGQVTEVSSCFRPEPHAYRYQFCGSTISVADPGSGAFLPQGSEIRDEFFPDPGSRIPDPKHD